jgi:hypothetical protein
MVFQVCVEIFLGPHIGLPRTITVGTGLGAFVGLFTSCLQWLLLRRYRDDAGWWIPATTIGCTAGGLVGSFFYSLAVRHIGPFDITLPSGGIIESLIVGAVMATCQWLVLRHWVDHARLWIVHIIAGMGLAIPIGWLAGAGTLGLLNLVLGYSVWPFILILAYIIGALAGGTIFALGSALALYRLLPCPLDPLPAQSTQQAAAVSTA